MRDNCAVWRRIIPRRPCFQKTSAVAHSIGYRLPHIAQVDGLAAEGLARAGPALEHERGGRGYWSAPRTSSQRLADEAGFFGVGQ